METTTGGIGLGKGFQPAARQLHRGPPCFFVVVRMRKNCVIFPFLPSLFTSLFIGVLAASYGQVLSMPSLSSTYLLWGHVGLVS